MKKYLLLLFTVVLIFSARAQQFTGQWKGEFFDKSTASAGWGGDRCDYVLELGSTATMLPVIHTLILKTPVKIIIPSAKSPVLLINPKNTSR